MTKRYLFKTPEEVLKYIGEGESLPTLKELNFHFSNPDRILVILKIDDEIFKDDKEPNEKTIAFEMNMNTFNEFEIKVKTFYDRYARFLKKDSN